MVGLSARLNSNMWMAVPLVTRRVAPQRHTQALIQSLRHITRHYVCGEGNPYFPQRKKAMMAGCLPGHAKASGASCHDNCMMHFSLPTKIFFLPQKSMFAQNIPILAQTLPILHKFSLSVFFTLKRLLLPVAA